MSIFGFLIGLVIYIVIRLVLSGFYTVRPDQRAVLTSFGRAVRVGTEPVQDPHLSEDESERYVYPQVQVIRPGGPYYKLPWQKVYKVSVSTNSVDLTWDPTKEQNTVEAVTKDNLTTGTNGQLRYKVSENNLYAYLFGVQDPLQHVMGFFIAVLRERIANFVDPKGQALVVSDEGPSTTSAVDLSEGVSINDLRKNLHVLNEFMEEQCRSTSGRYGIELDAALVTEIDPPPEVDRALSAINSTRNQVAADISTARADSEQQITMSNRAVEIATNNALAEVAPLKVLSETLGKVKGQGGSTALKAYLRNMRVPLLSKARNVIQISE
ncbi:MAG: regulator of protease activity HflC (stomatin/prohibitin superfamily) [Kiritimatiellia bacterium]|jgi:regulator of protease activity HflC (stomatin/prohibitin superfamily)